jgi:murein DD-endopeptidase MepM/ murein hydrolase activator NlpD
MPPAVDKTAVIPDAKSITAETHSQPSAQPVSLVENQAQRYVTHLVQSGHTLWSIANAYNVDAQAIAAANALPSVESTLEIGETLRVPVTEDMVYPPADILAPDSPSNVEVASDASAASKLSKASATPSQDSRLAGNPSANAAKKDTLASASPSDRPNDAFRLAKKPAVTSPLASDPDPSQLARVESETSPSTAAVDLSATEPVVPEIPAFEVEENRELSFVPEDENLTQNYRIRNGETLASLAREHGTSIEEIARANQLDDPDRIVAGQELSIPTRLARRERSSVTVFGESPRLAAVPGKKQRLNWAEEADGEDVPTVVAARPNGNAASLELPEAPELENFSFPEAEAPTAAAPTADLPSEPAEGLRADIQRLRDRVRHRNPEPAAEPSAEAQTLAQVDESDRSLDNTAQNERSNPQFDRQRLAALDANADLEETEDSTEVAVAPLGSQNYAPIVPPRSVSPDLPQLSAPGAYLPKPDSTQPGGGTGNMEFAGYTWPAQGVLSSGYGWRWGRMHNGIDIAGPTGTPIVAAAPGTVTYARWNSGGYGNLVEITHPDGSLTLYAHNNRILVSEGQQVSQGQQIAEMGSTGFSTGPHLHFEIHPAGQGAVNPMAFLP